MDARCSGRNTQRMAAAGRPKWSWLYLCVLMWLATITVPEYFLLSRWASDPDRGDFGQPVGSWLYIFLAVATVALGCAIGWQRQWTTLWLSLLLGALARSVAFWVGYASYGSAIGGEPIPEPGPFLFNAVPIGVLLGIGVGLSAVARRVTHPPGA